MDQPHIRIPVSASGILRGVLIGAAVSLVLLLRRGSRPHTAELGQVAGTEQFADIARRPESERVPNVFVFRCDGPLLFFNAEYVRDRFVELLAARGEEVELAIFFLGTSPTVDLAGAESLIELRRTLEDRGIAFRLAEAHGGVRDTLHRARYFEHGSTDEAGQTVASLVRQTRPAA